MSFVARRSKGERAHAWSAGRCVRGSSGSGPKNLLILEPRRGRPPEEAVSADEEPREERTPELRRDDEADERPVGGLASGSGKPASELTVPSVGKSSEFSAIRNRGFGKEKELRETGEKRDNA